MRPVTLISHPSPLRLLNHHHPNTHAHTCKRKGKQSAFVCRHDCHDVWFYARLRKEELRRSVKSRWPAGERNRSGGLLRHTVPLFQILSTVKGIRQRWVKMVWICTYFSDSHHTCVVLFLSIWTPHFLLLPNQLFYCLILPLQVKFLPPFGVPIAHVYQPLQFTVTPTLTSQSPYFFILHF